MLPRMNTEEAEMTRDEFLYELQKETLDRLRHYLCSNLQPERLFPWLQSRQILTTDDCEDIRSLPTTNRKVNKLIDTIKRSGPNCLENLKKAIEQSNKTQLFIAKKLGDQYQLIYDSPINQEKLSFITRDPPPPYFPLDNKVVSPQPGHPPPFTFTDTSKHPDLRVQATTSDNCQSELGQSCVTSLAIPPLTSQISQVANTGTYMRSVSAFHTGDYNDSGATEPASSIQDQEQKIRKYEDNGLTGAQEDQSMELEKIQSRSLSRKSHSRQPEEHDSSLSYISFASRNINETKAFKVASSPNGNQQNPPPYNKSHIEANNSIGLSTTGRFPRESGDPSTAGSGNSFLLHYPPDPDVSFEVSDGDI
uniref:Uncharacterized protein LOC100181150 n=1 Tax=Phallusia mammillata TaxID=59560 RepID=A0A6F9DGQ4_9ASCI|nr:uncharacterized protein LOC100181150 [Phallusia mammillata]